MMSKRIFPDFVELPSGDLKTYLRLLGPDQIWRLILIISNPFPGALARDVYMTMLFWDFNGVECFIKNENGESEIVETVDPDQRSERERFEQNPML